MKDEGCNEKSSYTLGQATPDPAVEKAEDLQRIIDAARSAAPNLMPRKITWAGWQWQVEFS